MPNVLKVEVETVVEVIMVGIGLLGQSLAFLRRPTPRVNRADLSFWVSDGRPEGDQIKGSPGG
jgi:hypothetical protein